MNSLVNKIMMGSRRFSGNAGRYLGHTQKGIRHLGSATNALNQLGLNSPTLNKVNTFAQNHINPAIDFLKAP